MLDLEQVYNEKFFTGRQWLMGRSREITRHLDVMYGTPLYTLDVGAGIADFTAAWLELGVAAYALEGSEQCVPELMVPRDLVHFADLRFLLDLPLLWPQKFDLITCWEVAEHIEEPYVPIFIQNLARFITEGGNLAMSICTTKGRYHYTVRPLEWWIEQFAKEGFEPTGDEELFRDLAGRPYLDKGGWEARRSNIRMLGDNMIYFSKRGE